MTDKSGSPRVSVIIPAYNAGRTLRECLDSVSNQTYGNYEVIAVDNRSSDDTADIIKEFRKKSGKVKYVFEGMRSAAAARNAGIAAADGDIIAFTDSDCRVPRNWIESLIRPIREEGEDVVCGFEHNLMPNYWTENIQKADLEFTTKCSTGGYIGLLDGKNFAIRGPLMRELMFDPQIRVFEDYDLYLRLRNVARIRFAASVKVGHYHKSSFRGVVRMYFTRGFWSSKICGKHMAEAGIKDDPMLQSHTLRNSLMFPFWVLSAFVKRPAGEAFFLLVSELSWRAGMLRGYIDSAFSHRVIRRRMGGRSHEILRK